MKLYQQFAQTLQARINCEDGNNEWFVRHGERIEALCKQHMPSGSGFDQGTTFNFEDSRRNRLVFDTAFHHMDENGSYCGWTSHQVIITPGFDCFALRVTGRNKNDIKDYIGDVFSIALNSELRD